MSRATDGKIRVAGLREAYQSILTERPKGVSCFYKRLMSVLKTRLCVFACGGLSQARCWCLLELVAFTSPAVRCLNSASASALMSAQKLVGHPLVSGFTLTRSANTWKPGHLRGEATCLADSRRSPPPPHTHMLVFSCSASWPDSNLLFGGVKTWLKGWFKTA